MNVKGQKRKSSTAEAWASDVGESPNGKSEALKDAAERRAAKRQRIQSVPAGQKLTPGKLLPNGKKNRRRDNNFVSKNAESEPRRAKESTENDGVAKQVNREKQSSSSWRTDRKPAADDHAGNEGKKKRVDSDSSEDEEETKSSGMNAETSESEDGEQDSDKKTTEGPSKGNSPKKNDPRGDRTMFLGNVPADVKQKKIRRLVSPHGEVDTIRIRNVVPEGPGIPKRAALLSGRLHESVGVVSMYVVFSNPGGKASVEKAVAALNMTVFRGKHLRATPANETETCPRRSVFVGNIPFDISEEVLLSSFQSVLEGGDATIVAARVVRDKVTGIGRGFGFISFSDELGVRYCMSQKDRIRVGGRPVRLDVADKKKNAASKTYKKMEKGAMRRKRFGKKKGKRNGAVAS